ncbi:MAG: DUF4870 domain-containing protein [Roseiflexaceae bacterium]
MSKSSRYLAFVAYLLSLPGALFVLLARRDDPFATYHARQSLAIVGAAVAVPLLWAVVAWVAAWIPLAGAVVGLALFALVIAAYIGLAVSWGVGMVFALQGRTRPVPLVGSWATRRATRAAPAPGPEQEPPPDLIERTSVTDA